MTTDVRLLFYSIGLTWIMLMAGSLMRARGWTPGGLRVGMGNRDDLPEPSPAAARADRAAKNMLENLLLFLAVLVASHMAGASQERLDLGARLFFYARLAYFPIYVAGIPYVRSLFWAIAVVGMGVMAAAAL